MVEKKLKLRDDNSKIAQHTLSQIRPANQPKDAAATQHSVGRPDEKPAKTNPVRKKGRTNLDHSTGAPELEPEQTSTARPDDTDLERRVLAYERILQTLIAHMAETEPKFLERLANTFCVPMKMERHEQDYTDTDSYAEEFIRSVAGLGEKSAKKASKKVRGAQSRHLLPTSRRSGFEIEHVSAVWRVSKDGYFHGDFSSEKDAEAAIGGPLIATVQPF